jgi:hydroxyacylglutathione hydrolase
MITIKTLVCNPYQENTYILSDEQGACAIIDPGMYGKDEENTLVAFISSNGLSPKLLLNTHCHIDHVLGNRFTYEQYGLVPQFHEGELPLLMEVQNYAPQMGFRYEVSPVPETYLSPGDEISLGNHKLTCLFAPGHSPGHLCFYSEAQGFLIGGDVLFKGSIGRTDLPGGDHQQLLDSIRDVIYTLPGDTIVYPGHGSATSIAEEKRSNAFIRG